MIESWVLDQIEPLRPTSPIILRDPQRILRTGAHVVDGWAEEHGYSVFFCVGNLALREMVEACRDDPDIRFLVVDRSRAEASTPLFYPDLAAQTPTTAQLSLDLRDFLIAETGDEHWPALVNERRLSQLILEYLPETLAAYAQLRNVHATRFTDSDCYRIVMGAVLGINPFQKLSTPEVRRLCLQEHGELDRLNRLLPESVMTSLRDSVATMPKPFCWLLERDPGLVVRAYTLAAILQQHELDYRTLLANIDPALHEYRQIDAQFLRKSVDEQGRQDPERLMADVADVEVFLQRDGEAMTFLLRDQLALDDPKRALAALQAEHLSELIRSVALLSLLADLLQNRRVDVHEQVQATLSEQTEDANCLALRRPSETWLSLAAAHRQALTTIRLAQRSADYAKQFQVTSADKLDFEIFHRLWNEEKLNRLDYYTSDLKRLLRVGDILPLPLNALWPELAERWAKARRSLDEVVTAVNDVQAFLNHRFQDLYKLHYADWIRQDDAPVIFTHQMLDRLVKAHWDPQSGRKAIILVFDGLRPDAWDEFLRPVFEERFAVIENRAGSAILPTETHLSRKAIAAGCLPDEFVATNELALLQHWLKTRMNLSPRFETIRNDDTVASGMTVRFSSDLLDYIIFNFSDKNLHNNTQELAFIYNTTLREIIRQDVRSVLRELPDDALIFITSDHGFTPVPDRVLPIPGNVVVSHHDVKYRSARTRTELSETDNKHVVSFEADQLGIPTESLGERGKDFRYLLFPRPNMGFKRPQGRHSPDPYNHGGLSLAECMVPMVVMGPKADDTPALRIDRLWPAGQRTRG